MSSYVLNLDVNYVNKPKIFSINIPSFYKNVSFESKYSINHAMIKATIKRSHAQSKLIDFLLRKPTFLEIISMSPSIRSVANKFKRSGSSDIRIRQFYYKGNLQEEW